MPLFMNVYIFVDTHGLIIIFFLNHKGIKEKQTNKHILAFLYFDMSLLDHVYKRDFVKRCLFRIYYIYSVPA